MKKLLNLIILASLFTSSSVFAQKSFHNKLTIDYTGSLGLHGGVSSDNAKQILRSVAGSHININYKVARKISLELRGGLNNHVNDFYSLRELSYGLGLNFFFANSYAPLGNSFGIYYQSNNFLPTDYNEFYQSISYPKVDYYETSTQINYKVDVIGFQFNYISMLSNKIPLYFKYGFHFCIPVKSQIFDASFNKESFQEYGTSLEYGNLNDGGLLISARRSSIFAFNVGLGYLF
jgi:hypothetical protein